MKNNEAGEIGKKQEDSEAHRIKKGVVEDICYAATNTFPNEFFALLGMEKESRTIDELVVVPADYGRTFTRIKTWLMPVDSRIAGSVHSHPSHSANPSITDLQNFAKFGKLHLIISLPFVPESIKAFDVNGKRQAIKIV
jgi:proteasome lid subunit RPN8/RPN11